MEGPYTCRGWVGGCMLAAQGQEENRSRTQVHPCVPFNRPVSAAPEVAYLLRVRDYPLPCHQP
jgi:hypothetical protein